MSGRGPGWQTVTSDRPLRGVVVGAGALGPAWVRELVEHPDTELVAWVDRDVRLARRKARDLGLRRLPVAPDLVDVLAQDAPDFVVNVTPPLVHPEITLAALACDAAVLSEKPLAATMEAARTMVAAAEASRRLLMVSQNRRYMRTFIAYRETIRRLGPLGSLTCSFYIDHRRAVGSFLDTLEEPLLLDMAIHLFDAARALSGEEPVSVYCRSYDPPGSWSRGRPAANAIFEMTGGVWYTFDSSWSAPGYPTTWTGSWRAVARDGTAIWDGEGIPRVDGGADRVVRPVRPTGPSTPAGRFYGLEGALDEFVRALRTGAMPQGEGHDNLLSLAMCHAAVESSRVGQAVPVSIGT